MPFQAPTRAQILEQIKADIRLELGADPLRRSPEYALARAQTGQSKGLYYYQLWCFAQCFPDTAEDAYFWRWFAIFGLTQKGSEPWKGSVTFTGTAATSIPAGTQLTRADGTTYATDAIAAISGSSALVAVTAETPGPAGTNEPGGPLTLSSPILGLDNAVTVTSTAQAGADPETIDEALQRLLLRLREPPSGGGPGDYERWALEVPGVTRAWAFPLMFGANTVGVAFVRDNDGTGAAIIPDSGERAAMLAYLQSKAPVTADPRVVTLTALVVDFTIADLDPNTVETQNAVIASLTDLFAREAAPDATLALSRIDAAISSAADEISHTLVSPNAGVVSTTSQMPVLGTVTFT